MVCLRNISVDTLHKGDTEDNNNNNNNNNTRKNRPVTRDIIIIIIIIITQSPNTYDNSAAVRTAH